MDMIEIWQVKILEKEKVAADREFSITGEEMLVGRFPGADILLDWDKNVSRLHAKIHWENGKICVRDMESTNGIFYLGKERFHKIEKMEMLPPPVVLKIGRTILSVDRSEKNEDSYIPFGSVQLSMQENIEHKKILESIMVLDICESTKIAHEKGDQIAFHVKKRLFQMADNVLHGSFPNFIKNTGDGFYATFENPEPCLESSIKILSALEIRNKVTSHHPINIRIALHLGETYVIDEKTMDRHGSDLNLAFRMCGALETDFSSLLVQPFPAMNRIFATRQFVQGGKKIEEKFRLAGKSNFKGFAEPVDVFVFVP